MRETVKVLKLASALAALVAPAATPIAGATDSDEAGSARASEADKDMPTEAEVNSPGDAEFMSFTVHQSSDGTLFPQHSSHSSHSSHVSHASSSPGYGGPDVPNLPNVPSGPYLPNAPSGPYLPYGPNYPPAVPPPTQGPPARTTTPTSDITYLACVRANSGLGVNDIASELERTYGISSSEAISIAKQALTAVLSGGHYCDGIPELHGTPPSYGDGE